MIHCEGMQSAEVFQPTQVFYLVISQIEMVQVRESVKTLDPSDTIIYRLDVINLEALDLSGAGSFQIQSLDASNLGIAFGGAGKIEIDSLNADEISVNVSGTGDIDLAGNVGKQEISIKRFGNYSAPELQSNQASVQIDGLGKVLIWVKDALTVGIDGAGKVEYYGSPSVTQDISGGGSMQNLGEK